MPGESWHLNQFAVVWPAEGVDAYGEVTRGDPVYYGPDQTGTYRCAWKKKRRQAVGPQGTPLALDASMIVLGAVAAGSLVYLGSHEDLVGTGLGDPPEEGTEIYRVESCDEDEDMKGRIQSYELKLARYSGTLPGEA